MANVALLELRLGLHVRLLLEVLLRLALQLFELGGRVAFHLGRLLLGGRVGEVGGHLLLSWPFVLHGRTLQLVQRRLVQSFRRLVDGRGTAFAQLLLKHLERLELIRSQVGILTLGGQVALHLRNLDVLHVRWDPPVRPLISDLQILR